MHRNNGKSHLHNYFSCCDEIKFLSNSETCDVAYDESTSQPIMLIQLASTWVH